MKHDTLPHSTTPNTFVEPRVRYRSFAKGWSRDRPMKSSVQSGSRAGKKWKPGEDKEIRLCVVLTDDDVARLAHMLRRPPSEIRTRHTHLLQQQLRERREATIRKRQLRKRHEAAIRISDRLNKLRQKRS